MQEVGNWPRNLIRGWHRSGSPGIGWRSAVLSMALCLSVAAGMLIGQQSWAHLTAELARFWVLPLPFWLIGILGIYTLAKHVRTDWLAPVNVVTVMLLWFFFLGPLIQIANDTFRFPYTSDPAYYLRLAGWLALLGLIAFLLGYGWPVRGMISNGIGRIAGALSFPDRFWLDALIVGTFALGIFVLIYRYESGGGLALAWTLRRAIGSEPWWMPPGILLANVACVLAYCYWGHRRKLFPFLLTLVMLLITFGLRAFTGRRGWALEPVIMVLFAARYLEKKFRPNLLAAMVTTVVLLVVLLWLGDYRTYGGYSRRAAQTGWLLQVLGETARLEPLMWVVEFIPRVVPHQWGLGFLAEAFPLFFGRIFEWSGITWFHTGQITSIAISPIVRAGSPSTPVGIVYHEFSVVGVALGFLLFGWLMKVLYTTLVQERGTPAAIAIYAPFLYFAWLYTIGGSWQAMYHLQIQVGFIMVLLFLALPRRAQRPMQVKRTAEPLSRPTPTQ